MILNAIAKKSFLHAEISGKPKAKIVERLPQFTQEELDELLDDETPWKPEYYNPEAEEFLHLSDKVDWGTHKPRKDLVGKSWQEKGEILAKENYVEDPQDSFTPDFDRLAPEQTTR